MSLFQLVKRNRSYRRFHQEVNISNQNLRSWINLARLSPSARNKQSLRYKIVNDKTLNAKVFPLLKWAGYIESWDGPKAGERPAAYIVILNDEELSDNYYCDDGIVSQTILLGAVESDFGGCIIAAINRPKLRELLNIDSKYKIVHLLALGKPKEEVQIDDIENDDVKYWRDKEEVHHVPKRPLDDLII